MVFPAMQFVGSNISSIIWHWRYILFILPVSSSSCFYNQIIFMTSTLLICKMKLVLIQKDYLIRKFQIHYCNSAHHQLNIPQQRPNSDLRLNSTKSLHATAVLIIVRVHSIVAQTSITNNDTRRANSTSTHTERFGLNGDSLPKFWSENSNETRATAEEKASNFLSTLLHIC